MRTHAHARAHAPSTQAKSPSWHATSSSAKTMRWCAADGCVDDDEADEEEDDEEDEDEEEEDEEDILELLSWRWELRQVQAGCRLRD